MSSQKLSPIQGLTHRSPTIVYAPYSDGPFENGWRVEPWGHFTSANNASLQVSWIGTGINITGQAVSNNNLVNGSFLFSIDESGSRELSGDEKNLLSLSNLTFASHTVEIRSITGNNLTIENIYPIIGTGPTG